MAQLCLMGLGLGLPTRAVLPLIPAHTAEPIF